MKSHKYPTTSVIVIGISIGIFSVVVYYCGSYFILNFGDENNSDLTNFENQEEAKEKLNFIFTSRDVVLCLDNLATRKKNKVFHIAFIGDSLVRNQFSNLVKVYYTCNLQL